MAIKKIIYCVEDENAETHTGFTSIEQARIFMNSCYLDYLRQNMKHLISDGDYKSVVDMVTTDLTTLADNNPYVLDFLKLYEVPIND